MAPNSPIPDTVQSVGAFSHAAQKKGQHAPGQARSSATVPAGSSSRATATCLLACQSATTENATSLPAGISAAAPSVTSLMWKNSGGCPSRSTLLQPRQPQSY